mmetsp:Transcript_34867/g.97337  ORF Transcript_34867/g.97337 Transcript_34867/m.97337 type:complete len:82 (-) Transcript_34867:328-573(-)
MSVGPWKLLFRIPIVHVLLASRCLYGCPGSNGSMRQSLVLPCGLHYKTINDVIAFFQFPEYILTSFQAFEDLLSMAFDLDQ